MTEASSGTKRRPVTAKAAPPRSTSCPPHNIWYFVPSGGAGLSDPTGPIGVLWFSDDGVTFTKVACAASECEPTLELQHSPLRPAIAHIPGSED